MEISRTSELAQQKANGKVEQSELAQRKRVGPITQRSVDRNNYSLSFFFYTSILLSVLFAFPSNQVFERDALGRRRVSSR